MTSETTPETDTVHDAIFGVARRTPHRPCLVLEDGSTWTYGDVDRRAAELAGALHATGVAVGDRVAVQVDKSADAVALYLACLRAGAVHVPLNTAYTTAEVAAFLDDAGAVLFVGRPGSAEPDRPPGCRAETMSDVGAGSLQTIASTVDPVDRIEPRRGADPAAMLYTSGTTGRSKGAVLSCRNLISNARTLHDAWHFAPDDVLLHVLPIFHVHGLFVALHCAFLAGATVRLHQRFDVNAVRRDLPASTVMMGVPTHYHRLLLDADFGRDDCASMRLFTSGSAPLPASEHDEFARRAGHRIIERYGMTETMILTSNPHHGERQAGTVGFPLAGVELRIADEDGQPVPTQEPGTVEVRGDGVFLGYHGQPEKTAAAFREDGWFVTGDIGRLDEDGRLTLAGRRSDLILSGGLNVYPKEVELVLDAVDGVQESAVVGLPDADFGESVVAVVITTPGVLVDESSLRAACESLARFKRPQRYVYLDELPRNAMGKVVAGELRAQLGAPRAGGAATARG